MKWRAFVRRYPVEDLSRWLGAPKRTIYAWRAGETKPKPWVQLILREIVEREAEGAVA